MKDSDSQTKNLTKCPRAILNQKLPNNGAASRNNLINNLELFDSFNLLNAF